MQRNVANVIIVILHRQDFGKTYFIQTEYLDKVNHNTIFQLLDKCILWQNNINHVDVLLFVPHAILYM